jgi:HPt (histidine-containing phosphotransfer) domain-containing protein
MTATHDVGSSPLDLAELLARCGDDPEMARELLLVYDEGASRAGAALRRAFAAGDVDGAALASHSLAGTLANVGARTAGEMARALRVAITERGLAAAEPGRRALEAVLAQVEAAVDAAIARLDAPEADA